MKIDVYQWEGTFPTEERLLMDVSDPGVRRPAKEFHRDDVDGYVVG